MIKITNKSSRDVFYGLQPIKWLTPQEFIEIYPPSVSVSDENIEEVIYIRKV